MGTHSQRRIGCLGLSANPPHFGHLNSARAILGCGLVDEVWLIPVFFNADKPNLISWMHRLKMTRMLKERCVSVCDIESRLPTPSFTERTLSALKKEYPNNKFLWILGADIAASGEYLNWHKWSRMEREFEFIVVKRPDYPIDRLSFPRCFTAFVDVSSCARVSSTEIRRMIGRGEDITYLVGHDIAWYIKQHGLYVEENVESQEMEGGWRGTACGAAGD